MYVSYIERLTVWFTKSSKVDITFFYTLNKLCSPFVFVQSWGMWENQTTLPGYVEEPDDTSWVCGRTRRHVLGMWENQTTRLGYVGEPDDTSWVCGRTRRHVLGMWENQMTRLGYVGEPDDTSWVCGRTRRHVLGMWENQTTRLDSGERAERIECWKVFNRLPENKEMENCGMLNTIYSNIT